MSEFAKRLQESLEPVLSEREAQKRAVDEEKMRKQAEKQKAEEALKKIGNEVRQFSLKHVKPIMEEIQKQIPGGHLKEVNHEFEASKSESCGWTYLVGKEESIWLDISYNKSTITLQAYACCEHSAIFTDQKVYNADEFDEQDAVNWLSDRAIAAAKKFAASARIDIPIVDPPSKLRGPTKTANKSRKR